MKVWRVRILKLEEIVFGNTNLVDKEGLYNVDDDGFRREVLKETKTNEDLNIESSRGSIMSPLKSEKNKSLSKQKAKSPVKKGKKGKRGKDDGFQFQIVEAETF